MRLIELLLIFVVAVIAAIDVIAATNNYQAPTTTAGHKSRKLMSLEHNSLAKRSDSLKSTITEEERESSRVVSVRAGHTARRTTTMNDVTTKNADGTITNSKYYNNGLVQRFQRWWNGLFKPNSARHLRQT
ncbi:hypothetical protein L917_18960 [Phytophthora nicotianae]|uniref:RxLR effector protein n=2 Tax=Phytophthora nicotianae TaxID=4792 RepID=W2K5V5_PHYNI|nr:hypothetical protein L917_18960 [Phytophthora nicotianae]ETO62300.1 hypothetical protein F444_19773 [Phytophthora nicotianae P1976]